MSYDYKAKKILMYGGYIPSSSVSNFLALGDAWYLEDDGWRMANNGKEDLFLLDAPTVFDFSRNSLVSIGGMSNPPGSFTTTLKEILAWDQSRWVNLDLDFPAARYGGSIAYDKSRNETILIGGSTEIAVHSYEGNGRETWVWDGTTWHCAFGCK
jgi:hypothetical protein